MQSRQSDPGLSELSPGQLLFALSSRPETREQVLLGEDRQKEKVAAEECEGCRRGRWHFTWDETTQLISARSATWLRCQEQVEIDHVAQRKQLLPA